ncbi:MAG: hypothetical protein ICV64_04025 [Thermoleophilia bacterium]|nr:hypothetical protein [Thermoleophilia bacterium]
MTARALPIVLAAAAGTLVAATATAQSATPRAALVHQATLFKQAKWRAMYATYTPRFRRNCPYRRFVAGQRAARRALGTGFRLRGIRTRLETRTRAVVAYRFVVNARTVVRVRLRDRDVYVKSGGRWLDEHDRVSSC